MLILNDMRRGLNCIKYQFNLDFFKWLINVLENGARFCIN